MGDEWAVGQWKQIKPLVLIIKWSPSQPSHHEGHALSNPVSL
jgi:hypothetical protein